MDLEITNDDRPDERDTNTIRERATRLYIKTVEAAAAVKRDETMRVNEKHAAKQKVVDRTAAKHA